MSKKPMHTLGAALALLLGAGAAQAARYTVINTNDSGPGSLRDAITQANDTPGVADTIDFSVSGTIVLASTLPTITDVLEIDGTGQGITISGNDAVRVMQNDSALTLIELTIANGRCSAPSCGEGAGVFSRGTLAVTNSTFSGNTTTGVIRGGAISASGALTISNSTFSGNTALRSSGGAIFVNRLRPGSPLVVTNSTFVNNASESGAAVAVLFTTATITNSTISGNRASVLGSALYSLGAGAQVNLANSIVASGGINLNCGFLDGANFTDLGGNLSDDASCFLAHPSSEVNPSPQLGSLQNNGGLTQTVLPATGSPAIDRGVNQLAIDAGLTTDQRGLPRIFPVGGTVDRGAVEVAGSFNFTGFFSPVDNTPTFNLLKAGSAVPIKFSLNGYQGLAIFAAGSPSAHAVACPDSPSVVDAVEETVTAGGSGLSFDATTGQYKYVWKTPKELKGQCRRLVLKFTDGSSQAALFQFN